MNKYGYKGPIHRFGHYICDFTSATTADTPQKALNNLTFKAKKKLNLEPFVKIELDKDCLKKL